MYLHDNDNDDDVDDDVDDDDGKDMPAFPDYMPLPKPEIRLDHLNVKT